MNALDADRRTAEGPPSTAFPGRSGILRSSKILDLHLDRLAIVYVRQSDPQQVLNHRESRERQYALADHAVALGWPRDRVLVIDDDQGQSGRTADQRGGFQRLLAEVTMEHVGLILGIEMSRIARNNKDWHNLLEMCAIFGTILADEDGVYDPQDTNDRLLLGLKGTISEFELVTMRNRLERGRLHKAQRGELFHRVPTGYVKLSTERVEFDPDEQVREVVRLIFDKYDEIGTAWGVFHYLIRNNIKLGFRPFHGPNRGNLEWRRPVLLTVFQILRHPIYAGAYSYGRRPHKRVRTATGRTHQRRQLGPDGAVEGSEARLPSGLHHLGSLHGESRIFASAPLGAGLQGKPPRRLRAAHRPDRLRQLRPLPPGVLSDPMRGPITVASGTSTRGRNRRASASRPRRSTTSSRSRFFAPWNPPRWS